MSKKNEVQTCLQISTDEEFMANVLKPGVRVRVIRGANAPQIEKTIKEHVDLEDSGQPHQQVESDDLVEPIISFISPPVLPVVLDAEEPENEEEEDDSVEYQMLSRPQSASRRVSIVLNDAQKSLTTSQEVIQALENTPVEEDGPVERTLAMLKPDAMFPSIVEEVLSSLYHHRFQVVNVQKIWLNREQAMELYKECASMDYYSRLVDYISCGPVLAMELSKVNAIQAWRDIVGPRDPRDAQKDAPRSLRGLYGQDRLINTFHASDGPISAERELAFIFGGPPETFLTLPFAAPDAAVKGGSYNGLPQKTLAVIKPHCMLKVDEIIAKIVARGIHITKRDEVLLSVERAQELSIEFLETPAFEESVQVLMSAPVLCLTLKAENVIESWLEMLGPSDPLTAKTLFPMSLRAQYGISPTENGLHGSPNIELAIQQLHSFFPHYLNKTASLGSIFKTPMGSRRASLAGSRALLANESLRASVTQLEKERGLLKSKAASMIYTSTMGLGGVPFMERTLALLKPDVYPEYKDQVLSKIRADGFTIVGEKEVVMDKGRAEEFYREQEDSPAEAARQIGFFFGSEVSPKPESQRTLALIKPDAYPARKAEIISKILKGGFTILKEAEVHFNISKAEEFYKEHSERGFYGELTTWMSSAPIYAMVLERAAAINEWRNLAGPTNSNIARETAPYSIRAQYGTDGSYNAVHGSDSRASAEREIFLVFGDIDVVPAAEPETIEPEPVLQNQEQTLLQEPVAEPDPESSFEEPKATQEPKAPRPPSSAPHPASSGRAKSALSKAGTKSTTNIKGLSQANLKTPSTQNLGPGSKVVSSQNLGPSKLGSKAPSSP
ncbi:UNVERIFIED_CONTAM: Thioredoxin domain-containing protein 3, partial [Siphonaria sp. JEL0065]